MSTDTMVNLTQATEVPTQATDVLQVATAPEHGVIVQPVPASSGEATAPGQTGANSGAQGVGIEGEESVWVGHYSYKNYASRILVRALVTGVWLAVLWYMSGGDAVSTEHSAWNWIVGLSIAGITIYWLLLFWQMMMGRKGHRYELTTRRLFIDTGLFRRRRDQMELLKIQDIYVKQPSLLSRLFDTGTVVVETSEERLPIHYIAGVDHPTPLMDLIWHHARKERDLRSVKVDQV